MKKSFFTVFVSMLIFSLSVFAKGKTFEKDGYIFSKAECEAHYGYNALHETLKRKECWMPTVEQVRELESNLESVLKSRITELEKNKEPYSVFLQDDKDRYKHLKNNLYNDYFREYWGIVSEDNEKIIFINAFCASGMIPHKASDLGTRVHVSGGGSCYFKAAYDVAQKKFFNIKINAPM